jgi:hypothetical protein
MQSMPAKSTQQWGETGAKAEHSTSNKSQTFCAKGHILLVMKRQAGGVEPFMFSLRSKENDKFGSNSKMERRYKSLPGKLMHINGGNNDHRGITSALSQNA